MKISTNKTTETLNFLLILNDFDSDLQKSIEKRITSISAPLSADISELQSQREDMGKIFILGNKKS